MSAPEVSLLRESMTRFERIAERFMLKVEDLEKTIVTAERTLSSNMREVETGLREDIKELEGDVGSLRLELSETKNSFDREIARLELELEQTRSSADAKSAEDGVFKKIAIAIAGLFLAGVFGSVIAPNLFRIQPQPQEERKIKSTNDRALIAQKR